MLDTHISLGTPALRVPMLAFGTAALAVAPFWNAGEPIPEEQSRAALHYAYDQGIRWFDTAPNYMRGLAEVRTGQVISKLPREQIIVATKVGFDIRVSEVRRDYTRDGVMRSLEGSLERLSIDAVDVVYVHDPDGYTAQVMDETFPALSDLRRQGMIRAIGAGMSDWRTLMEFTHYTDVDCLMIAGRWTLLEQQALPLLDRCFEKGIVVFAASIYNSGILATGAASEQPRYNHAPASPEIIERVRAIETICDEFNVPLHTVATQYPFTHPAVKTVVVGFQSAGEVRACLNALNQPIPDALWQRLVDHQLLASEAPLPKVSRYDSKL